MKKTIFILAALLAVPLCLSLSSCSSDDSDEVTLPPQQDNVVVTTLAGSTQGYADGTGSEAQFSWPCGIAIDASGNLYVVDYYNHCIRKVTPSGVVTTFAGNGTRGSADGLGSSAEFDFPRGIAIDVSGNLYVADNNRIRKITPAGMVTTLAGSSEYGYADGTGSEAIFWEPEGIAIDTLGNLYVIEHDRIRKVTSAGVVTTLAGSSWGYADGVGSSAEFAYPRGIAIDASGNLYVTDYYNRIRKVTPEGVVTTFAGSGARDYADGTGSKAQFSEPWGIAIDVSGNLYVADKNNNRIRKVTPAGVVTTLAGNGTAGDADGTGSVAQFYGPIGIAIDALGSLYVADYYNHRIRKIEFK